LLEQANANGFTSLLTRDRLFKDSAAKAFKQHPHFSIILIAIPQAKFDVYNELFAKYWHLAPITPRPGQFIVWP
jgi:hypothetical protein